MLGTIRPRYALITPDGCPRRPARLIRHRKSQASIESAYRCPAPLEEPPELLL
jgi:hypothetical protein